MSSRPGEGWRLLVKFLAPPRPPPGDQSGRIKLFVAIDVDFGLSDRCLYSGNSTSTSI